MLGYIRGERYSLAVDAGNSRRHVEKFYAALDAAELRRPDFTVLTHWHWDHTFGLHAVDGAAIACEATNEISVVPAGLVFHGRLSIDLGGVHCVLLQTEAPHERDCVLVHVPEQGILFAGDADCGDFYSLDGGYDKARLKRYLASVEAMEFKLYVPGHGAPERKAETLAALRAVLESLEG